MELNQVKIDSFKSLIDEQLEFTHSCLSLVGVNESGKTNLLKALSLLSPENPLKRADVPKMLKGDPRVRFDLTLSPDELEEANVVLTNEFGFTGFDKKSSTIGVTYEVSFDRESGTEDRQFSVLGTSLPKNSNVLVDATGTELCVVLRDSDFVPVADAMIVDDSCLKATQSAIDSSYQLFECEYEMSHTQIRLNALLKKQSDVQLRLSELENGKQAAAPAAPTVPPAPPSKSIEELTKEDEAIAARIVDLNSEIDKLKKKLDSCEKSAKGCRIGSLVAEKDEQIESLTEESDKARKSLADIDEDESDDESTAMAKKLRARISSNEGRVENLQTMLEVLKRPIASLYSKDNDDFVWRLGKCLEKHLQRWLPNVVFWKYSDEYILSGETSFDSLLEADGLEGIPRPLVNLFRIGSGVRSFKELKSLLTEIAEDSSERSRVQVKVNKNVDKFLKGVWKDYDQEIQVTLEHDRIRVEFFDPNTDDASFYRMQERSQGCQTFVSFLMTVGAEARKGVIRNTLLLLDEPETHLHPSGVRFMLKELIKAAQNNNRVVFATHSIFMIDKEQYDRHVIVAKKNEKTHLKPSTRSRIGFFMQEEVLYSTLDVDVASEIAPRLQHNFVFEGHGDAVLFETYYSKALNAAGRPFPANKTSFHHGGKCSDIMKYFSQKPIQLGTYWVFVLDSDGPANELKKFIESKYKDFIDKYIFVFQYSRSDRTGPLELEDLLPQKMLQEVCSEAASRLGESISGSDFKVDRSYSTYFPLILEKLDEPDEFKAVFKEMLNIKIENSVSQIKNESTFSEMFPEFAAWATTVFPSLPGGKPAKVSTTKKGA